MLKPAILYKDELQRLFKLTWFNDKYKFWWGSSYFSEFIIEDSSWNSNQFAVISNNKVIGYIGYSIDRDANYAHTLSIISFADVLDDVDNIDKRELTIVFGNDLKTVIKDIFEKYCFIKLCFTVYIGNPVEKQYDKLIKAFNGRIVGIRKCEAKTFDGIYRDQKIYEILGAEYFESFIKRR